MIDPQVVALAITVLAVLAGTISFHLHALEETVHAELQKASAQMLSAMNARFDSSQLRMDDLIRAK